MGDREESDFFKEDEQKEESNIEKIKLGDREYTQDELTELVGLGEKTREIESSMNTKIDRVYPEYTKSQQRLKEYENKLREIEEAKSRAPELNEDSIRQAREAAKKIGIVTEDAFTDFMGKHFRNFFIQERAAEKLVEECQDLEGKYNGNDGLPKFKTEKVLEWMKENGSRNPEQAYKMMNEKEIDDWKARKLAESKRQGLVTETSGEAGGKIPPKVSVNRDNIEELMREALEGKI